MKFILYFFFSLACLESIAQHPNDIPSTALVLTFGQQVTMDNINAVDEADGTPNPSCGSPFVGDADVFATFTTTCGGTNHEVDFVFGMVTDTAELIIQVINASTNLQVLCFGASTGTTRLLSVDDCTQYYMKFWDQELDNGFEPEDVEFELTVNESVVLPVEFVNFTATAEKEYVQLFWQTASEINNEGYNIQRSNNSIEWEEIGFVEGKGTTYNHTNYQFIDDNPFYGLNYYRLEQQDFDGAIDYSPIVSISYLSQQDGITVFPNPTNNSINIQLPDELKKQPIEITVTDLGSQVLIKKSTQSNSVQLDLSQLIEGHYILRVSPSHSKRIIKIKN